MLDSGVLFQSDPHIVGNALARGFFPDHFSCVSGRSAL